MVTAIALWSHVLIPGEPEGFSPPCDLRITNVALGDELEDETGRTTLKLTYRHPSGSDSDEEDEEEDEEDDENEPITTVLCSLTPGKIEQAVIDIVLEQDQDVLFELVGKNPIYLTGNFIDQEHGPHFPEDDADSDEEGYHLEDVSSDVEIDPEELEVPSDEDDSHRFEEVPEGEEAEEKKPVKESKKRSRDSDAMEVEDTKLSKAEKKANKKLKADEAGKAVPTGNDEAAVEVKANGEPKKEKKKKDKKAKDGEAQKEGGDAKAGGKGETKVLAGGLKVRDHKVGTGQQAKSGDTISVRYVGKLDNGSVFDSNTKGKPFTFNLGAGEVIKGWDQGVAGMHVGGERLLVIPPALGYGKQKQSGIPASSTLTFEVKLVKIK